MRKRSKLPWIAALAAVALSGVALGADETPVAAPPHTGVPFELRDGDRVVFVGGTLIEREGQSGYLETMLAARWPDRNITFRNLGQSGDTVLADARNLNAGWANFGPPDQGFKRLQKLIGEIKPTVIIANFGMTESFEGEPKLAEFKQNYDRLVEMMVTAAGTDPRVVLLSPNYHERIEGLPDPAPHNAQLRKYGDAIRDIAQRRGALFVDLYRVTEKLATEGGARKLTDNGIHPTADGFRILAGRFVSAVETGSADDTAAKPPVEFAEKHERVRKLVVAKNFDYFNYWRPQNDTYILGVRKKEQGRNAVEMPQFIPLAEQKEKQIREALTDVK